MDKNLQAIILAAGKSTRFNTEKTKLAEPICGQPMIIFPTKLLQSLQIHTTMVVGYQHDIIKKIITKYHDTSVEFVLQEEQNGTGHALACTQAVWHAENILVMNGDAPLISPDIITLLHQEHIKNKSAISFVVSSCADESGKSYGRVVHTDNIISIVEAKDFKGNPDEQHDINAGIYLINKNFLQSSIAALNDNNASKEFYITDLVEIAHQNNLSITLIKAPFNTIRGINTLEELLIAEQIKNIQLLQYWMHHGVRFGSWNTIHIDVDTTIGQGSLIASNVSLRGKNIIGPNCIIKEFSCLDNVILEENVTIHSHSVMSNCFIQSAAEVGPFAHLRSNVTIGKSSIIGNFVEVKNSTIGHQTKAKHLSYIGDCIIGSHVNIGAGTITCNYDGAKKHTTTIHDNAFIGSNNTLIAPITIGNNAFTAAGSTITDDVPANALAIARSHQTNKYDYAKKLKPNVVVPEKETNKNSETFSFIGARIIHPDSERT